MTDRTGEFQGAVKVFRSTILSSRTAVNGAPLPGPLSSLDDSFGPPPPRPRPEKSEFFRLASSVAVGFEGTAKLIERLKKLVGRKGFSNNPAAEINDVMKLFEADIAGLQRDIATLQRHTEGKSRGSPPLNSQQQKHCQHLVATLRNTAQEHTKAFRDALLLRAAVEKQQTDRQRIFSHSRGVAPATQLDYPLFGGNNTSGSGLRNRASRRRAETQPPSFPAPSPTLPRPGPKEGGVNNGHDPPTAASSGNVDANPNRPSATPAMPRPEQGHDGSGGLERQGSSWMATARSPFGSGGDDARSAVNARISGYSTGKGRSGGLDVPLPPTEPYRAGNGAFGLRKRVGRDDGMDGEEEARRAAWQVQLQEDARDRVEESHKVEKMIGDLGQMFSRFSTMVAAQEDVVIHIEDDVEAAHAFAAEGQANLAKYYQIMSGNRGIIIKVFILLIVFIWFFLKVMR